MSVRALLPLFGWLRTRGADIAVVCARAGLDIATLLSLDSWIPRDTVLAVWQIAVELYPDASPSMRALEIVDMRLLDILQYNSGFIVLEVFAMSATVGDGLDRLVRYYGLTHGSSRLAWVRPPGDRVELELILPASDGVASAFAEFSLGLLARMIFAAVVENADRADPRRLQEATTAKALEAPGEIREIRFAHPGPADISDYQRVLGAPVRFSAERSSLVLSRAALSAPLRTKNELLLQQVLVRAEEMVTARLAASTLSSRVRAVLAADMPQRAPSAESTARALAISVRHLARRLGEEGTSHQALLDSVRAEQATKHLLETDRPVEELPALLGFSEPSSFRRAFRRWFGCSPTELRNRRSR